MALGILGEAAQSSERLTEMVFLTLVSAKPSSYLFIPFVTPELYILLAWSLQGMWIGAAVAWIVRRFRWDFLRSVLLLVMAELLVPAILAVLSVVLGF